MQNFSCANNSPGPRTVNLPNSLVPVTKKNHNRNKTTNIIIPHNFRRIRGRRRPVLSELKNLFTSGADYISRNIN